MSRGGVIGLSAVAIVVVVIAFFLFAMAERIIPLSKVITKTVEQVVDPNADLPNQPQLQNPPSPIKALYFTGWSAGSERKVEYALDLLNTTELNAIVIDVKDYTGKLSYDSEISQVNEYGAVEKRIAKINKLIKRFHDAGVYVIARIAVFQDNALVAARPDLALHSIKAGTVWADRKGIAWLDAAATPVWDYNIAIAREALAHGFDEVNFDYIRFPTDGNLDDISFPYYDGVTLYHNVIAGFFDHVRHELPYAKLSADLFGEVTYTTTGSGIGQYLEDAMEPFDAIAPMIYPSHYAAGFLSYQNPANYPYEVVRYSMDKAFARLSAYRRTQLAATSTAALAPGQEVTPISLAEFRPWLQDFNLGATYDAAKVRAQIQAVYDSARAAAGCPGKEPDGTLPACPQGEVGWMLWNPSNVYTRSALLPN